MARSPGLARPITSDGAAISMFSRSLKGAAWWETSEGLPTKYTEGSCMINKEKIGN